MAHKPVVELDVELAAILIERTFFFTSVPLYIYICIYIV